MKTIKESILSSTKSGKKILDGENFIEELRALVELSNKRNVTLPGLSL